MEPSFPLGGVPAPFYTAAAWALAAVTPALILRIAISLAVLPLLFFVLRDESEGAKQNRTDIARRVFWAILGAAVFFILSSRWAPAAGSGNQGRGFEKFFNAAVNLRLSYSGIDELAEGSRPKALKELQEAAGLLPESAYVQRYAGIALAGEGNYAGALARLNASADVLARRAPERAARERQMWQSLYGEELPTRAEIETARRQLQEYGLGWLGRVAALAAYRRLGANAAPAELRTAVRTESQTYARRLMLGGISLILLVPQLGLISLAVGIVLARTGVARAAPRDHHPVSHVLWESFILMLACSVAPGFIAFGGRRMAPETQPGLIALLMLASDLLQLIAVGYLAWRLRRHGLGLAEIGLTTRHLWPNILIGAMAATIIMPSAALINLATQAISDRFFPTVAPPYHPLGGMTATSTSAEIRWSLFIAAAVGAPLFEEIFFRGALFGALRRRHRLWLALVGSSAFFAILHPQLPLGFLPIAVLGGAFAWLYDWRQSLVPGIVAHAINNGLIFVLMTLTFPPGG